MSDCRLTLDLSETEMQAVKIASIFHGLDADEYVRQRVLEDIKRYRIVRVDDDGSESEAVINISDEADIEADIDEPQTDYDEASEAYMSEPDDDAPPLSKADKHRARRLTAELVKEPVSYTTPDSGWAPDPPSNRGKRTKKIEDEPLDDDAFESDDEPDEDGDPEDLDFN